MQYRYSVDDFVPSVLSTEGGRGCFSIFTFGFPEEVAESGEDRGEPVNHRVAVVSFSNCDASEARRGRLRLGAEGGQVIAKSSGNVAGP